MALLERAGGETTIDLDQNDGEYTGTSTAQVGASVTLVADHPSWARSAQCYDMNMSASGAKGHVSQVAGNRSGSPTTVRIQFWFRLNAVTTPAFDVPIWKDALTGTRYTLQWQWLTDGKVHMFDGAGEINSANAWTPTSGSGAYGAWIGIRISFLIASPFTITVESTTDSVDGSGHLTWTTHQSGAGASVPPNPLGSYFGEDLGSGVNHNWNMRLDNVVSEDDVNNTFTDQPIDVVIDGLPVSGSDAHDDWHNTGGTACSTGGANCYATVDDGLPPATADYVEYNGTAALAQQAFPTSALKLISTDTVMAVSMAAYLIRGASPGSSAFAALLVDGGTDISLGGVAPIGGNTRWGKGHTLQTTNAAGSAWTVSGAQAAQIGYEVVIPASDPKIRCAAMYKLVTYKRGVAAAGRSFGIII